MDDSQYEDIYKRKSRAEIYEEVPDLCIQRLVLVKSASSDEIRSFVLGERFVIDTVCIDDGTDARVTRSCNRSSVFNGAQYRM